MPAADGIDRPAGRRSAGGGRADGQSRLGANGNGRQCPAPASPPDFGARPDAVSCAAGRAGNVDVPVRARHVPAADFVDSGFVIKWVKVRARMKRQMRQRGMTLIELAVSLLVLGVAMAALVQLVSLAARQRRATTQRRVALQEVANQSERIALLPWSETEPDKLTAWQASAELADVLPAAKCSIAVSEESDSSARRIRLEVG